MGKASSNKKVARAAGTGGGRTNRGRTPWTYYGAILVVVVLGVVGTVTSRNHRIAQINGQGTVQPTVGTVWNEGFAVYACGKFLPPFKPHKDPYGITTQGDGIIHIHPTVKSAAGKNATLGKFASSVGMTLNAAVVQIPGGKAYQDGASCGGGKGHVYVKQFAYPGDPSGIVLKGNPTDVRLANQQELVVAFVPSSKQGSIPAPPASVVKALKALAPPSKAPTTTTLPASAPTTAPGATTVPATLPGTAKTVPATPGTTVPASTATTK